MIGIDDMRRYALALPEVEEGTHFGLPSFSVRGKGFANLQKGDTHALLSVSEPEAEALAAEDPQTYEAVSRNGGRIFVGVRIDLAKVTVDRLRTLFAHAWRHRAPKRLVAAHPEIGDELPPKLGAPAERALAAAGYTSLGRLTSTTEEEIAGLHGVGPSAVRRLREALVASGRSFADG